jgi:predicted DCC family thiol-disulfide oxidoreductase YuxK
MREIAMAAVETSSRLVIVYDGQCPFCTSYVRLMALRKAVGEVDLIDARSSAPVVLDLVKAGYDLNEGMAAIFGGKVYHGSDAVVLISTLTEVGGGCGRPIAALLRSPVRAKRLYPLLKIGRRFALAVLGRRQI